MEDLKSDLKGAIENQKQLREIMEKTMKHEKEEMARIRRNAEENAEFLKKMAINQESMQTQVKDLWIEIGNSTRQIMEKGNINTKNTEMIYERTLILEEMILETKRKQDVHEETSNIINRGSYKGDQIALAANRELINIRSEELKRKKKDRKTEKEIARERGI